MALTFAGNADIWKRPSAKISPLSWPPHEEAEANAIGAGYARAGLLPVADASKVRELLANYLNQRVLFYTTRNAHQLDQINASTARLQSDLSFFLIADLDAPASVSFG